MTYKKRRKPNLSPKNLQLFEPEVKAINEEINALERKGGKEIDERWIYTVKHKSDDTFDRYTQSYGTDQN